MEQKRTEAQNGRFHALINELRYDQEEKAELVLTFSASRTASSRDLTFGEMRLLIKHLEGVKDGSIKKMRSKIIHIAKDIGLTLDSSYVGMTKQVQVDFGRLNVFLVSKFKKKLHELQRHELPAAVTAMEAWRDSNLKKELGL